MKAAITVWATGARRRLATWLSPMGQIFWPWLEKLTPEQKKALSDSLTQDEARINALDFSKDGSAALEEARRLADSEAERRRGTDQKAATYLPLVAALIPLVLTLVSALWEKKAGSAPIWLNMLLLGLAVVYIASAGHWAFQELRVGISHEPGLADFEKAWRAPHPSQVLARHLLLHTRRNREGINWKVTCIKMAHEYLLRAFLTFSVLLLVNIGWYLAEPLIQKWMSAPGVILTTPRQAIAAVADVDNLATRLRTTEAWTVLDNDCRQRTAGRASLTFAPGVVTTPAKIPLILRPAKSESGAAQNIRLDCAGKAVGLVRTWFIPTRLAGLKRSPGLPDQLAVSATNTVVAITRNWPPIGINDDPAKLPATMLQQADVRRDGSGRPIVLAITAVGPGAVTIP
ncbi:hypothetical protein [Sphingopyxis yananensis]|uniref:hypothetical protein n=1 Tax=Sphingopyxis yananensis TaxID=2886687 RepID=UPI001D12B798|nr:hypothetical protein [Sphingopyxis yananensis]MCC2602231.1 hypothetical protein [Sphingopyxis yananensis]